MRAREHNRIITAITIVALIVGILSILCLDSDSWIPVIILAICSAYLLLFCLANCTNSRINTEGDIWDEINDKAA